MSALESLTEVFGESGCGDNSERYARELLAEHRAEVLGETYPGELAMLRGLVRTLRPVARYGTDINEVRKLLAEHAADDAAARLEAKEKSSPAGAEATPDFFQAGHTYQRRRWQFQVLAIAPSPFDGQTRAVGFLYREGEPATPTAMDSDAWSDGGWTDVAAGVDE